MIIITTTISVHQPALHRHQERRTHGVVKDRASRATIPATRTRETVPAVYGNLV